MDELDRLSRRLQGTGAEKALNKAAASAEGQRLLRELVLQTGPDSEGISLKNLADELNLSSSAVSVMVEMLVQKKVLERKSSEVDRRQVLIRLSDAAWESVALYDELCRKYISDFTDDELSLLRKISGRLSKSGSIDTSKNN